MVRRGARPPLRLSRRRSGLRRRPADASASIGVSGVQPLRRRDAGAVDPGAIPAPQRRRRHRRQREPPLGGPGAGVAKDLIFGARREEIRGLREDFWAGSFRSSARQGSLATAEGWSRHMPPAKLKTKPRPRRGKWPTPAWDSATETPTLAAPALKTSYGGRVSRYQERSSWPLSPYPCA